MKINIHWGGGPEIQGPALLGLDVEGKQRGCRLIQLGYGTDAWLYDPTRLDHRAKLFEYLKDSRFHFLTHSRYDQDAVYWSFNIDLTGRIRDTYLLACLVFPGKHFPHGIKPLSTLLLDGDLEAGEKRLHAKFKAKHGGRQEDYLEWGYHNLDIHDPDYEWYSAADAVYVWHLYPKLKSAHEDGVPNAMHVTADVFFREQELSDIMGEASRRGNKINRERAEELLEAARSVVKEADKTVRDLTGFPARSKKVPEWLEERGVVFEERTEAGNPKLDKDVLKVLVPRYEGTEVGTVLAARQRVSKNSNRVSNLQNFLFYSEEDGAIHPRYQTAFASTGRWSVVEPATQTIKKVKEGDDPEENLRTVIEARPGYVLIGADFDTQEMRVAAGMSGDTKLAQVILDGVDMHNVATESIYGPDSWKNPDKRAVGKVLNFAALYGAGAKAIADQTGLETWQEDLELWNGKVVQVWRGPAYDALQAWWAGWPQLKQWNKDNQAQAQNGDGWVILDSGRMVAAPAWKGYALTNTKVQGTSRDITCQAVLTYARLMPGTLAMVIHDEILAEVKENEVEDGLAALTQAMNFEFFSRTEPNAIPMPITATAEILGERWVKV